MPKFRKRPVVIEAVQFNGKLKDVEDIFSRSACKEIGQDFISGDMTIDTLEGVMTARKGDWIILGVAGELYPCKPDIFEKTYEPA